MNEILYNHDIVTVKQMGPVVKLSYQRSTLAGGGKKVNIQHPANAAEDDEPSNSETTANGTSASDDTEDHRKSESERISLCRSKGVFMEYALCNHWDYMFTITLDPSLWNRDDPITLLSEIQKDIKLWRKKSKDGDCAYLIAPSPHEDGAIHAHGFLTNPPMDEMEPYTLDDVLSNTKIPSYICDAVREGRTLYHNKSWDKKYGYNLLEAVSSEDDVLQFAEYTAGAMVRNMDDFPFASRYTHSRGLKRAETIAKFKLPGTPDAAEEYSDYVEPIASTQHEKKLHFKYYLKLLRSVCAAVQLVSVTTIIRNRDMPTQDILDYLEQLYRRFCSRSDNRVYSKMHWPDWSDWSDWVNCARPSL